MLALSLTLFTSNLVTNQQYSSVNSFSTSSVVTQVTTAHAPDA